MTVLRVDVFGGEIPRIPARGLPPDAAQINQNLLATATEFRPLRNDSVVGTAPAGAKTLYRLAKNASGAFHTLDTAGWIAEAADKNYVKGQINDDGTERTYVTFNDGTQLPRAIDALGSDRLMGVPAPFFATAVKVAGVSFSSSQAAAWSSDTLVPALHAAALAGLGLPTRLAGPIVSTVYGSGPSPTAGAFATYGMTQNVANAWITDLSLGLEAAKAGGLNDPAITPLINGATLVIPVHCLPAWGVLTKPGTFAVAVRAIKNPRDGTQLYTETEITSMTDALVRLFDPNSDSVKTLRTALDVQVQSIRLAVDYVLSPPTRLVAPVAPIKPNVPEFSADTNAGIL